ncbi:MAG: Crp/Fnr family transcriptional regulator [Candidatus Acidiferrales bacterium]
MLTSFDTASHDASVSSSLATVFRGKLCDTLLRNRSTITFDKGAIIYDAGDKGRTFFFVRRGVVKVGIVTGDGHEIIYDLRKEGDVVGELCAYESVRRDRAVALEPTELMAVPFDEILDSLQKNRAVLQEILEVICRSLSGAYDQADLLSSGDTVHRLIKVLLKLADQLGRPAGHLVEIGAYLTQEEISQMMAASRERVSGVLNLLRNRGMVEYSRGGHLLLDIKALKKYQG